MEKERNYLDLKERLAALEHARWSHWQQFMHGKCIQNADGSLTIPIGLVEKWNRQSGTQYSDLHETEKQSDRDQVEKYFFVLEEFIVKMLTQEKEE